MESQHPKLIFRTRNYPEVDHINNTCKTSLLSKLKEALPKAYKVVKEDPIFKHFLAINDNDLKFSARLVHSLLCRQLVTTRTRELWFVFGCKPLRFSLQEFHAITGLNCKDEQTEIVTPELDSDDGFWSILLKENKSVSVKKILGLLEEAKKWKSVDRVRLVYICVIAGFIMAKDEKTDIPHDYIKLAMDLDQLRAYPWGRKSFQHLLVSISKAKENIRNPKSYVLNGFTYAFQIWVMEAVPSLAAIVGVEKVAANHDGPRCSNWTGLARASYDQINQLDDTLGKTDIVHTYLPGEVCESIEFLWDDEVQDPAIDALKQSLIENTDFRIHDWGRDDPLPSQAVEKEDECSAENDLVGEGNAPDKRRRLGDQKRKRELLSQRLPRDQGSCLNNDMKTFLNGLFECHFGKLETRLDKHEERMSKMEDIISQLTVAVSASRKETNDTASHSRSDNEDNSKDEFLQNTNIHPLQPSLSVTHLEDPISIPMVNLTDGRHKDSYMVDTLATDNLEVPTPSEIPKDSGVDPTQPPPVTTNVEVPITAKIPMDSRTEPPPIIEDNLDDLFSSSQSIYYSRNIGTQEYLQKTVGFLSQDTVVAGFDPIATQEAEVKDDFRTPENNKLRVLDPRGSSPNKRHRGMPPLPSLDTPKKPEELDVLTEFTDESFERMFEWSKRDEPLQLGPCLVDRIMINRIMSPTEWFTNNDIDAMMYIFRENTNLGRWDHPRDGFLNCIFSTTVQAEYGRFMKSGNKKDHQWGMFLEYYVIGYMPSHGRSDKMWVSDISRIYTPVHVNGNHWVGICIHFLDRLIEVFDCMPERNSKSKTGPKYMDPFRVGIPRILKASLPPSISKSLSVAPYNVKVVDVKDGLNKSCNNCGAYAIKFIECHVRGLEFSRIDDDCIKDTRQKIAIDIYEAAMDPELQNRTRSHVLVIFPDSEVVDLH